MVEAVTGHTCLLLNRVGCACMVCLPAPRPEGSAVVVVVVASVVVVPGIVRCVYTYPSTYPSPVAMARVLPRPEGLGAGRGAGQQCAPLHAAADGAATAADQAEDRGLPRPAQAGGGPGGHAQQPADRGPDPTVPQGRVTGEGGGEGGVWVEMVGWHSRSRSSREGLIHTDGHARWFEEHGLAGGGGDHGLAATATFNPPRDAALTWHCFWSMVSGLEGGAEGGAAPGHRGHEGLLLRHQGPSSAQWGFYTTEASPTPPYQKTRNVQTAGYTRLPMRQRRLPR